MGWANKLTGWTSNNGVEVNSKNALLIAEVPAGASAFCMAAKTGTIAAAAAAGAAVFAIRVDPGAGATKVYIDSLRLRFTTIVAFTTAVTQTRSIVVTRGSGAATAGGTSLPTCTPKDTDYAASECDLASGGDVRIATTGALTVTGITWEAQNLGEITLSHNGAAGAFHEAVYEYSVRNHPIELHAGQLLGIRVGPSAMDAAGTWSLGVDINWHEGTSYTD